MKYQINDVVYDFGVKVYGIIIEVKAGGRYIAKPITCYPAEFMFRNSDDEDCILISRSSK